MLKIIAQLKMFAIFVCLAGGMAYGIVAQEPVPKLPPEPKPRPGRRIQPPPPEPPSEGRNSSEKAIAVAPGVSILLPCISQARVTINGWRRDEIRVFVRNGSSINFEVREKDPKTGKPVWVTIGNESTAGRRVAPYSNCISGERIDIEVPYGASLSIAGRKTETRIDSVKRVEIKNADGNVTLRNVAGGIAAETYKGDVAVESSAGQITLKTTTGNIIAFEVNPGQVGDVFRAMTSSGTVTLQRIEHRQIDANSVSGTLLFNGKFLPGGIYKFKTSNGSMKLALPAGSSCKLAAWYGFGSIDSELPWKIITENVSEGGKSLVAMVGGGGATVNLTTNSGNISITRQ